MKCDNPNCNGAEMTKVQTRDDGCSYYICPICQQGAGEETDEWFEQQYNQIDNQEKSEGKKP